MRACAVNLQNITWHGLIAQEKKFLRGKSAEILCIILSKHIQNMHTVFAVDPH